MNCQSQEQYQQIDLYNPGIIKAQVFGNIFHETKTDIEVLINSNKKDVVESQYTYMIPAKLENFIYAVSHEYLLKYKFMSDCGTFAPTLKASKVSKINLQKKYEFRSSDYNSNHSLEWVLFMQIPYESQDEHRMSEVFENGTQFASKWEFIYNTLNAGIMSHCIDLNKSIEGTMLMYPGYMKNIMYPFYTSDDYRVFLTGKIWTLNQENKYVIGRQKDIW